ncbi:gliding motility protein GldL [Prevotella sp. CAG:1124]|nr:gliding motility protein GldL [Prevotella sp. CAG:1124]
MSQGSDAAVAAGNVEFGSAEAGDETAGRPVAVGAQPVTWMSGQQQVSPELEEATVNYVEELKKLTETLAKVSEQSARLTRDSEEMENLNRTLTGICKVYEMQLKGASSQIGTIDQINEQSRKMASQIEQLNKIYARMIEAMTVNMRAATTNGNNSEA